MHQTQEMKGKEGTGDPGGPDAKSGRYSSGSGLCPSGEKGFFADEQNPQPNPGSAFSITLSPRQSGSQELMNTKARRPVDQALLHSTRIPKGKRVISQVANCAVFHGLDNQKIRATTMHVLRRCLLLATEYDLEIEASWIRTRDNALAAAIFRFAHNRIANVAPQVIYATCNHQDLWFLTYNHWYSHQ